MPERINNAARELSTDQAAWRMCELAGFVACVDSPAVEPLRRLQFRHEARVPPALECWHEALAVLEDVGELKAFEAFVRGPDRTAGRWPTRERWDMEQRMRRMPPVDATTPPVEGHHNP